jgi:hypothetical protein
MGPTNFGALMYQCWFRLVGAQRIYWGGIFTSNAEPGPGVILDVGYPGGYIDAVYEALLQNGRASEGAWPWNGINIHIHSDRSDQNMNELRNLINKARSLRGETGEVIVGEWGVTEEEEGFREPGAFAHLLGELRRPDIARLFSMTLYHAHHRVLGAGEHWSLIHTGFDEVPIPPRPGTQPWRGRRGYSIGGRSILYDLYDPAIGAPDAVNKPEPEFPPGVP